jgi:hypothetical protein
MAWPLARVRWWAAAAQCALHPLEGVRDGVLQMLGRVALQRGVGGVADLGPAG